MSAPAIDGMPADATADESGYLRLARRWPAGTALTLDLEMSPTAIRAHDRVDAVRGRVAITRGPLVYCLEQADLAAGVTHDDISLIGMPVATTDTVLDVPVMPRMHARVTADAGGLYRESVADSVESESRDLEVTAIPYFRWANRAPGPMRAWIPQGGAA